MGVIQFVRHFLLWLKYRKAVVATNRDELEYALRRMPPRIVVEGDEALRAYAATLAFRDGESPPAEDEIESPLPGSPPIYLVVPTIGRIRDGYRQVKRRPSRTRRPQLKSGLDFVLVAVVGIVAALLMEVLSFLESTPDLVHGPAHAGGQAVRNGISPLALPTQANPQTSVAVWVVWVMVPVLGVVAAASLAWLIWHAAGLGRPIRTIWRVEYRVQGRLVMARVRKRAV